LKDPNQLVRLGQQAFHFGLLYDACINNKFQPESGFVSFFNCDSDLRDKVGARPAPASTSVISRDRRARAQNLPP